MALFKPPQLIQLFHCFKSVLHSCDLLGLMELNGDPHDPTTVLWYVWNVSLLIYQTRDQSEVKHPDNWTNWCSYIPPTDLGNIIFLHCFIYLLLSFFNKKKKMKIESSEWVFMASFISLHLCGRVWHSDKIRMTHSRLQKVRIKTEDSPSFPSFYEPTCYEWEVPSCLSAPLTVTALHFITAQNTLRPKSASLV